MRLRRLSLLLVLPIAAARAQGDIHRCVGADGQLVFTDRVCSDVNAKPVLPPASASTAPALSSGVAQPPPPLLCAADMGHLKQAVVDAFASHNPNRLAGLMLWDGAGQQAVVAHIRAFALLMDHPLVGVDIDGDESADDEGDVESSQASASNAPAHGETLVVQTESDDGSGERQEASFDVIRHAGCLWLQPQD
jgi:hypothetical protein